jgi:hypothetical protein
MERLSNPPALSVSLWLFRACEGERVGQTSIRFILVVQFTPCSLVDSSPRDSLSASVAQVAVQSTGLDLSQHFCP